VLLLTSGDVKPKIFFRLSPERKGAFANIKGCKNKNFLPAVAGKRVLLLTSGDVKPKIFFRLSPERKGAFANIKGCKNKNFLPAVAGKKSAFANIRGCKTKNFLPAVAGKRVLLLTSGDVKPTIFFRLSPEKRCFC
jgi:hypothetical protein